MVFAQFWSFVQNEVPVTQGKFGGLRGTLQVAAIGSIKYACTFFIREVVIFIFDDFTPLLNTKNSIFF